MSGIVEISDNKRDYMDLLLLGDEQESMIERYLDRGRMFALENEGRVCAVCVVTDEGSGTLEIKNIAVSPGCQRRGYGRALIGYISEKFSDEFHRLIVGTGDSSLTVPFYENCGFRRYRVVKDFFTDNYDHMIIEGGVQLRDMIYFEKTLKED